MRYRFHRRSAFHCSTAKGFDVAAGRRPSAAEPKPRTLARTRAVLVARRITKEMTMSPIQLLEAGRRMAERIPYSAVALVSRFALASVFWRSAQPR
jgi:hypothetical protein